MCRSENRFGVKKNFVLFGITIGGDCDGEENGDDRERLLSLLQLISIFLLSDHSKIQKSPRESLPVGLCNYVIV